MPRSNVRMREADKVFASLTAEINGLQPTFAPITVTRMFGQYRMCRGDKQVRPIAPYRETLNFLEGMVFTLKGW